MHGNYRESHHRAMDDCLLQEGRQQPIDGEAWHAQPHQMLPLRQDVLGNDVSEDATLNLFLLRTPQKLS